jgi:pimeloyl-ACP methyl ester carboxylesterase
MKDTYTLLADGRRLQYADLGDPDGHPLFFFHGAPASRLNAVLLDAPLAAAGIRVIATDRPGYGGSSVQPKRTLATWPKDVAALADALDLDEFMVAGHSSGGPYALACAAALPKRVQALLVMSGVTDMGWAPAWQGFVESEHAVMRMTDLDTAVALCTQRFGADGSTFLSAGFELPPADQVLFADPNAVAAVMQNLTEAFKQGIRGYVQDVLIQGKAWTFDPGRITCTTHVVHGEGDTLVPIAHSRHTAELIPGARFRVVPGHGHLTIVTELPALARALVRDHVAPGSGAEYTNPAFKASSTLPSRPYTSR